MAETDHLPERVLCLLDSLSLAESVDSQALAEKFGQDHQKIVGAIKSLEALGQVIETEAKTSKAWELTEEGRQIVKDGSHEARVFGAVPPADGITQPDLAKAVGATTAKVGLGKAMANGWLSTNKEGKVALIKRKVDNIEDKVQSDLIAISKDGAVVDEKAKNDYKKRKLLQEVTIKGYSVKKGSAFTTKIEKPETDLTPEMIASGAWKTAKFKPYNFQALGIQPPTGHLNQLLKVRAEYRQIFLEMGFSEMPTNNYVESSFWNFDALFQPQQHPARDAHDTFFISQPAEALNFPQEYLEKVKEIHSVGGFGSQGYGYDWKIEEAKKNLLRTHTTAVSARMLYKVAQDYKQTGTFRPAKFFSIDRVFRNETLDATHLAEFHQVEGLVADRGLTLGDLLGVIHAFFKKLGIEKLRFKPAYNPYTEPSMEIFAYHEGLGKWLEIGNSGMFRPEMLLPMGLPEDVKVIAWGLALERPTMIKYGIDNIRDLVGHKINLKMVQESPICRLDKDTKGPFSTFININEKRWENIEKKLHSISARLAAVGGRPPGGQTAQQSSRVDIVVCADPFRPPHSLKYYLGEVLAQKRKLFTSVHLHSSVTSAGGISPNLTDFLPEGNADSRTGADVVVTLIWKKADGFMLPSLCADPRDRTVFGEVNVGRYFARIVGLGQSLTAQKACQVEEWLDRIHAWSCEPKGLSDCLKKCLKSEGGFLIPGCACTTVADVHLLSLAKQIDLLKAKNIEAYKKRCIATNPLLSNCLL